MIKIRDKTFKQIVYLLRWIDSQPDFEERFRQAAPADNLRAWVEDGTISERDAFELLHDGQPPSADLVQLHDAIRDASDGADEDDLIDTLQDVLRHAQGSNVLGGAVLNLLRKSLLGDSDYKETIQKLKRFDLVCAGCGKGFKRGEMASAVPNDGGRDANIFFCTRCDPPYYMACKNSNCDHVVEIPGSAYKKAAQQVQCYHCGVKASDAKEKKVENAVPADHIENLREQLKRAARRAHLQPVAEMPPQRIVPEVVAFDEVIPVDLGILGGEDDPS